MCTNIVSNVSTNEIYVWSHIEFAQIRVSLSNFDKLKMIQNMLGDQLGVSRDGEFALSIGY